jgi:hypothetical protein
MCRLQRGNHLPARIPRDKSLPDRAGPSLYALFAVEAIQSRIRKPLPSGSLELPLFVEIILSIMFQLLATRASIRPLDLQPGQISGHPENTNFLRDIFFKRAAGFAPKFKGVFSCLRESVFVPIATVARIEAVDRSGSYFPYHPSTALVDPGPNARPELLDMKSRA